MPEGRETGRIGDKYELEYYRQRRPARSWKWLLTAVASLLAVIVAATLYGVWGENAFQSAPLSSAHASFGNDCRSCHDRPWQPAVRLATGDDDVRSVTNKSCQICHTDVSGHQDAVHGESPSCAACHAEHRPERDLLSVADAFCVSCHGDLTSQPGNTGTFHNKIESFAGSGNSHPEFAVLAKPDDLPDARHGVWNVATRDKQSPDGPWLDAGGLKFNHAVHLAAQGLLGPDRKPTTLSCESCHVREADGALMAAVNYEQHCAVCHPLRLTGKFARLGDIAHESPTVIRGMLRERLAQEMSSLTETPDNESGVDAPSEAERDSLLPRPGLISRSQAAFVDAELAEADHAIFGLEAKGFCRKCHHVTSDGALWEIQLRDPALSVPRNEGRPARELVPSRWLKQANFNHDKHRAAVECSLCHQAARSTRTGDILLPTIDVCRKCHGAASDTQTAAAGSRCSQCHDYHHDASGQGANRPQLTSDVIN